MVSVRKAAVVLTAAACSAALCATPASAHGGSGHHGGDPIHVIASGLNGPFELSSGKRNTIYVTENGAGQVTAINLRSGRTRPVVTGLGANAAAGAVRIGDRFAIVTGASDPSDTSAPSGPQPGMSVLTARAGGTARQLADLLAFELRKNPDGQTQFGPDGAPLDALSNPFYVLADRHHRGGVLVADGGANDVLRVDRRGRVSTFFVPPTVNTGACAGLPNNDEKTVGCDAVPTGLAYGPGNTLYVSALTAEVPGEGRVYVLNATTGKLQRVIKGFSGPTGVAVDKRKGTVYVSELLEGAPADPEAPPPGFDPSTMGQIVKVTRNGQRSTAQVTMPVGLLFTNGTLYSSAWSLAGPDAGQVVRVGSKAFTPVS